MAARSFTYLETNMKIRNKENDNIVLVVASNNGKISQKNGFIRIVKGSYNGFETVRADIILKQYNIPSNALAS